MQRIFHLMSICTVLPFVFFCNVLSIQAQSLNNRVLVIYNRNVPESLEVANHYMVRRGIPANNLLDIGFSNTDDIPWNEYNSATVRFRIQGRLNELGRGNILYIVFSYRTPYRMSGATITPVAVPAGDDGRGTSIDQYVAKIFDDSTSGFNPYYVESFSKANSYRPFILLAQHRSQTSAHTYSVWRLDAPSVELSKGLVDKAIAAETGGLQEKGLT